MVSFFRNYFISERNSYGIQNISTNLKLVILNDKEVAKPKTMVPTLTAPHNNAGRFGGARWKYLFFCVSYSILKDILYFLKI
jgi:hypothetical protein